MISDELLELITADVDGRLSASDSRRLRRLLDASPEAYLAHARLMTDSKRLRSLQRIAPPPDFLSRVMARLPRIETNVDVERALPISSPVVGRKRKLAGTSLAQILISLCRSTGGTGDHREDIPSTEQIA